MNRILSLLACGAVLLALCGSAPADSVTTLTFDSVNTGAAPSYINVDATAYFASYGVTLSGVTPGTSVAIINYGNVYGGIALNPYSGTNMLEQINSNDPVSFTLSFATPLTSFGFTIPGNQWPASPSAFPAWQVYAYDSSSSLLSSASGGFGCCQGPLTYTLNGPNISEVVIASQNYHFAAFNAVPLDNLVLTAPDPVVASTAPVPEPASLLLFGTGLAGVAGAVRRRDKARR